jgi:hypothetical protein
MDNSWPSVTGAIVGAFTADGWIDAATIRLTSVDLKEISQAIERTGAGAWRFF